MSAGICALCGLPSNGQSCVAPPLPLRPPTEADLRRYREHDLATWLGYVETLGPMARADRAAEITARTQELREALARVAEDFAASLCSVEGG